MRTSRRNLLIAGTSFLCLLGNRQADAQTPPSKGGTFSPPTELSWPAACNGKTVPQSVRSDSRGYVATDFDPKSLVDSAIWSAKPYYVNASMRDDSGDGLKPDTAKQSIAAAIQLANADGQKASRIYVAHHPAGYSRTTSINGVQGGSEPLKPTALIAIGGRVRHTCGTTESYPNATHATYTHSFVGGASSAVRVFDRLKPEEPGLYAELRQAGDAAGCDATPNSWAVSDASGSAKVHIHRADGLRPTLENTLICRDFDVAYLRQGPADLYIEGFDFEGGQQGAFVIRKAGATRNVVLLDCSFRYAGSAARNYDGLRIIGVAGLVFLDRCDASKNWKDGFNVHETRGSQTYIMGLNLTGWRNGRAPAKSCNYLTLHEAAIGFFAGGSGGLSVFGAEVHNGGTTKAYIVGMTSKAGRPVSPLTSAFRASDAAKLWLENCTAESPAAAIGAIRSAAVVYRRNLRILSGTELTYQGGRIESF